MVGRLPPAFPGVLHSLSLVGEEEELVPLPWLIPWLALPSCEVTGPLLLLCFLERSRCPGRLAQLLGGSFCAP